VRRDQKPSVHSQTAGATDGQRLREASDVSTRRAQVTLLEEL
jgi:hypothetical protein